MKSFSSFLLILIVLPCAGMQAQWRFGAFAGMNYSGYSSTPSDPYKPTQWNGAFGVRLEYALTERWSAFAGTQRTQKLASTHTLDFIEIPIGAKYFFAEGSFSPYCIGGAGVGFLLNPEIVLPMPDYVGAPDGKFRYKPVDFPVFVGIGVELSRSENAAFTFEIRYSHGVLSVAPAEWNASIYPYDWLFTMGIIVP